MCPHTSNGSDSFSEQPTCKPCDPRPATDGSANVAAVVGLSGFMQIGAHPDDDIYFMDPEIMESIRAGVASTSVFLTAGEIQDPLHTRQNGMMAAHAALAEVASPSWTGSSLAVGSGALVEVYTLDQRTDISLVFVNLPDGTCLTGLEAGTSSCTTLNPQSAQTGVNASYNYTRTRIVTAIATVIAHFAPAALRIMDALPDNRYAADHIDHIASAKLANSAVAEYQSTTGNRILVTAYRAYNIGNSPDDLSVTEQADKAAVLAAYTAIATHGAQPTGWGKPQYVRRSRGTRWVGRNVDGTLQAFAVAGNQVLYWRQLANGTWGSAQNMPSPGGPLAPGLCVDRNPDGRLQVVGRRLDSHEVMTIAQTTVNGSFPGSWSAFGNPNDFVATQNRPQIGPPIQVRNQDGLLQIFVKNGGGGVSTLVQINPVTGGWNPNWFDLGGSGLQDELAGVLGTSGRIELFGYSLNATRDGRLATWYQSATKTTFTYTMPLVATNVASGPTPAVNADGRIQVFYRQDSTANAAVLTQSSAGGPWNTPPSTVGTPGGGTREFGVGPALSDGRLILFGRNADGTIGTCRQTAPNAGFGAWQSLVDPLIDTPSSGLGPDGRLYVLGFGVDGNLYTAAQTAATPTAGFGPWTLIG